MSEYQNELESHTRQSPLFLRLRDVADLTAMGASTILAWEKSGKFPQAIRLSPGKRVWLSADVDQWVHLKAIHKDGGES